MGGAPRPALPLRPGAVRPGPLDGRVREGVAALRVLPVWRRSQAVHRCKLCHDGGPPHPGRGGSAVQDGTRARPEGRALPFRYAQAEGRDTDDLGQALAWTLTSSPSPKGTGPSRRAGRALSPSASKPPAAAGELFLTVSIPGSPQLAG